MWTDVPFWRLVWKEYRTHRPLWLAILIGTPVLQLCLLQVAWIMTAPSVFSEQTLRNVSKGATNIAFVGLSAYLIGCVGTMFSIDHETGVFARVRLLPTTQLRVFWSKIGFALASCIALAVPLGLFTFVAFGCQILADADWNMAFAVLLLIEVFAWSLFSSLWIRQPLWGIVVVLGGLGLNFVVVELSVGNAGLFQGVGVAQDNWRTTLRLLFVSGLLGWNWYCARLWFEERLRLPTWTGWRGRRAVENVALFVCPAVLPIPIRTETASSQLHPRAVRLRLLWQGWREVRYLFAALGVVLALVLTLRSHRNLGDEFIVFSLPFSLVCGVLAFGLDQQGGRFRYFVERGCPPRDVWLCRQVVWFAPVLLAAVLNTQMLELRPGFHVRDRLTETTIMLLLPTVCFGFGQLAAMLVRSPVVALVIGLALSVGGLFWTAMLTEYLLMSAWWSVGGLPLLALFATWLKANDWIEERRDWQARRRTWLGLTAPATLLLLAVAGYRVVQIPVVTLPAEWTAPRLTESQLSATDRETLELYRRAGRAVDPLQREHSLQAKELIEGVRKGHPDWSEAQIVHAVYSENQAVSQERWTETAALLKEALTRPAIPLTLLQQERPPAVSFAQIPTDPGWLFVATEMAARASLAKGELDTAWREIEVGLELERRNALQPLWRIWNVTAQSAELIAEWGRHPGQTRERITAAIRSLAAQESTALTFALANVRDELNQARLLLRLDPDRKDIPPEVLDMVFGDDSSNQAWRWFAWRWLLTERARSERFLRWEAALAVESLRSIHTDIEQRRAPGRPQLTALLANTRSSQSIDPSGIPANWTQPRLTWDYHITRLRSVTALSPPAKHGLANHAEQKMFAHLQTLRAAQLQLALADWQREHGTYPETLDTLVPTYFDRLPLEPVRALPFGYFPSGLPQAIRRNVPRANDSQHREQVIVAKDEPFLWVSPLYGVFTPRRQSDGEWLFDSHQARFPSSPDDVLPLLRIWRLPLDSKSER